MSQPCTRGAQCVCTVVSNNFEFYSFLAGAEGKASGSSQPLFSLFCDLPVDSSSSTLPGSLLPGSVQQSVRQTIQALFPTRHCAVLVQPVFDGKDWAVETTSSSSDCNDHLTEVPDEGSNPTTPAATDIETGSLAAAVECMVSEINYADSQLLQSSIPASVQPVLEKVGDDSAFLPAVAGDTHVPAIKLTNLPADDSVHIADRDKEMAKLKVRFFTCECILCPPPLWGGAKAPIPVWICWVPNWTCILFYHQQA